MKPILALALAASLVGAPAAFGQVTGPAGGNAPVGDYQASLALTQQIDTRGIFPCNGCSPGDTASATLGMVRTFAGNFAAFGEPTASGQILPIVTNTAVFSIMGTTYGGNGVSNFALPDLGGRAIVGAGQGASLSNWDLGQTGGQASVVLTLDQLGAHDHGIPGGNTGVTGSGLPVDNLQPSLAMNYLIATGPPYPTLGGPPFTGSIAAFAGNFAPAGWTEAAGQLLSISSNTALFSILGTTYGGDGLSTFALPDLRGRVAVGAGAGVTLGEDFGSQLFSLSDLNLPSHVHSLPGGGFTDPAGGGLPFDNAQPSLGINYLISLEGVFPSRDSGAFPSNQPLLGEITGFAGDFAPTGFALAQGQLLAINQNTALFSLLGTAFGGDGIHTFALPDLRGRTIIGTNGEFSVGDLIGERDTTLTVAQMAIHDHSLPMAGVPEPSTWVMMLAGFGFLGASLRSRRGRLTVS